MEDKKSQNIKPSQICAWCDGAATFSPNHRSGNAICMACYKLLIRAGVSEEEIFKKVVQKDTLLTAVDIKPHKV